MSGDERACLCEWGGGGGTGGTGTRNVLDRFHVNKRMNCSVGHHCAQPCDNETETTVQGS